MGEGGGTGGEKKVSLKLIRTHNWRFRPEDLLQGIGRCASSYCSAWTISVSKILELPGYQMLSRTQFPTNRAEGAEFIPPELPSL